MKNRLEFLRSIMREKGLSGYLVPRADEFQGEFVAPYAERLKWLTGFTGSGGLALVLEEKAYLLTDGRYLLQAESQVDGAAFNVGDYIKIPTGQWIADNSKEGAVIGFDPYLFTPAQIEKIETLTKRKGIRLKPVKENLVDSTWGDQPSKPTGLVTLVPDSVAGATCAQKRAKVAEDINELGAAACLLTMPDSVSWLLNVRGSDIDYIPSVLSTVLIDKKGAVNWFVDAAKVPDDVVKALGKHVQICKPDEIGLQVMAIAQDAGEGETLIVTDMRYTPLHYKTLLESRGVQVQNAPDPTIALKAQKTPAEQDNIKEAHITDGVAIVKFLAWLDEDGVGKTELDVVAKLLSFRQESPDFKQDSFPTISGFGANGAIIHYRADEKTNTTIEEGSLLLVDSGGQYAGDCYGTTDITRTVVIGEPSQAMRENFTRVLKGHISLSNAKFPPGTVGAQVDILARKPLWDAGLDYAHGTGHGVGCYLAVHEEAANISSRGQTAFAPGMLISNEPGYYEAGAYGIRTENLVLVIEEENGMFAFETVTFAPIDRRLIIVEMLDAEEKEWLNNYHQSVLEKLAPYLEGATKDWLTTACALL